MSVSLGEARCQPGVCRGSETSPMMGGLRVALRTRPSSVASLGRVTHAPRGLHPVQSDDARSTLLTQGSWDRWSWEYPPSIPGLYRGYCGQHTFLQGGAQEPQSGFLGRGGRAAGGGGVSVEVLVVLFQTKVLQRFVEQIIDDSCRSWTPRIWQFHVRCLGVLFMAQCLVLQWIHVTRYLLVLLEGFLREDELAT